MSDPDYAALQAAAEAEGLRVAVGALVVDAAGRAFVHRRGPDRELYPDLWDIVGGHVEPGESMLEALAREVEEETGWRVVGTPVLAHVADWDGRREFDFPAARGSRSRNTSSSAGLAAAPSRCWTRTGPSTAARSAGSASWL